MKVKPMHDRVAAEVIKEETTKSGIIVTTNQPRDTHCAKVVAVGPDVKNITVDDTIALTKRCGDEIIIDDKSFIVVKETNVLAILEE